MLQQSLTILLDWCRQNNVWIDPRLSLRYDSAGSLGVFSTALILNSATGAEKRNRLR